MEKRMLKRLLSVALAGLLLNVVAFVPVRAATKQDKEAQRAEKVKKAINKLGTGEKARVHVRLKDKTQVKGYVSQIDSDDFQITDAKTGTKTTVAYTQVKGIEGKNWTTGQKIAVGVGIAAAVVLVLGILVFTSLN
jgi:hypothetical protein